MELPEEKALLAAYKEVAAKVAPSASVPDFLAACEVLVEPIDGYFEKVGGKGAADWVWWWLLPHCVDAAPVALLCRALVPTAV